MLKHAALFAGAAALVLLVPAKPFPPAGSWQVDMRHSDAQFTTDGTTNFGKTKTTFIIGFARVNGTVKLDGTDSANSAFDFRVYPACSMAPQIDEEGKVRIEWFANHANCTLICFHSKGAQQTADGGLKTTGNLVLIRRDRNVEVIPNEAYAGPVYGPPMIHRVSHEATFFFDFPNSGGSGGDGAILTSGSSRVVREDFPPLVKAVIATYWPPVVQDENCQIPVNVGEGYSGAQCTGTFLETPALPEAPHAPSGEDYPGPLGFNAVVGNRVTILVHMRLTPVGSGAQAASGN